MHAMTRVLLIGIDGAEPTLVRQWINDGSLPNLGRLAERGSFLPCQSTIPPATFPAWTTCVTGVNPGKHGVFDFTEMAPGKYALRFVNATYRRAPALWNVLSSAGKRVCVLGVPGTYPPEKINGVMVSGFDSPVCTAVDASFVQPPSEYELVKDWRFADFQEADIGEGWHEMAFNQLMSGIDAKERIALSLLKREPWDFFMIVFGESDTVAHHFWPYHDPNSPRHMPGMHDAIRQIYARIDRAIGQLIAAAGEDRVVMIVSDHGFGGAGTGVIHINNWLAERGHLHFAASRDSLAKRLAMRFVPPSWQGRIFRALSGLAARAEGQSRFGGIDWNKTIAWSEELNYFPSIRLNVRGREPHGQIDPSEYTAVCRKLCDELESWEVIQRAMPRDDIYDGPFVSNAPDIVLQLALEDGYSHSCLRSRGGPAFRRISRTEFVGGKGKGMSGNHRAAGTLIISEPVFCGAASLQDVAPTVLSLLSIPAASMDGTSLVSGARTSASVVARAGAVTAYSPDQEREIESRLRKLGYFE
jgi:predicted AlkP superfamily phosphohydrolase/phosphomutase